MATRSELQTSCFDGTAGALPVAMLTAGLPALADAGADVTAETLTTPTWRKLLPAGELPMRDGRAFRLPDPVGVVAASDALRDGVDLVVDYDHQTDRAPATAGQAPAAGWISRLEARADGIWGLVAFTAQAAAKIAAREYRYLSPVFQHDPAGRIRTLLRVGLVNSPAITAGAGGLPALAAQSVLPRTLEEPMDATLKALCTALSLPETTERDAAIAAVSALKTRADGLALCATAVGLAADATAQAVADGVRARVDPTRYVPAEVVAQLQAQLATAETANRAGRAEKAVKDAIAAGKLPPAQEAWALAYAAEQPDAFTAFIARQPVLLPPGQQGKDGTPPGGSDVAVLSAEDKAVAKRLGISEQAMLASKAATTKTQEG